MGIDFWAKLLQDFLRPPAGLPSISVGASVPLGSGLTDPAQDIPGAVAQLTRLQSEAIAMFPADPTVSGKWVTKCNVGLQHVAAGMGCHDCDGRNAQQIIAYLSALSAAPGALWRLGTFDSAVAHAQRGRLAVIGYDVPMPGEQHCHVVSVAARPPQWSSLWNAMEPICANVGKPPNDFKRLSDCFLLAERPMLKVLLWRPA